MSLKYATDRELPADRPLSKEEALGVLDERARRYLGMSGPEFQEAAKVGGLPDSPAVRHLLMFLGEAS